MKFDQTSADTSLGGGWVGRRGKKLDFGDLDLIFKVTLPFGSLNFIGKKKTKKKKKKKTLCAKHNKTCVRTVS